MTTGAIRAAAIRSAALMPSSTGIFTSSIDEVGPQLLGEPHGLLAVARLADDVVALLAEHLHQVEADERLVLGDDDAQGARGSAGVSVTGEAYGTGVVRPRPVGFARRPDSPTGRGSGLKHHPVWVRIPLGAPAAVGLDRRASGRRPGRAVRRGMPPRRASAQLVLGEPVAAQHRQAHEHEHGRHHAEADGDRGERRVRLVDRLARRRWTRSRRARARGRTPPGRARSRGSPPRSRRR